MTSINPIDYFKTTELDAKYDFNKDGTVTIEDYHYACKLLVDDIADNDPEITKDALNQIFAALIEQEKKDYPANYEELDTNSTNTEAEKIIKAINSAESSPSSAQTLNQLQQIAANLTKYIKQCAELAKVMEKQIPSIQDEVNALEELKKAKEAEYANIEEEIKTETEALNQKLYDVLDAANRNNRNYKNITEKTVAKCIQAYAEGQYPNETLYNVIARELAMQGNFDTTALDDALKDCTREGETIKSLCNKISNLVVDLRDVESKYKDKNAFLNRTVNNRTNLLSGAETANRKYQTGYAVRETLRKNLVDTYTAEYPGGDPAVSSNPQVQSLANFLNNKELDNMPYADAVAVMFGFTDSNNEQVVGAFTKCGIKYDSNTGAISIPYGHDNTAKNIFNALVQSLHDNYGINANRYEDAYEETTPGTPAIKRNDPIGFSVGDVKYDFIQDNNNDGIFNDMSEFLGAENGWQDMFNYDKNGDGVLTGNELKALKMVGKNQTNGQFSFTNAAAVGVTSIDLNSYKEVNKQEQNKNITAGTFEVNLSGTIIEGKNTFDGVKNLNNEFATVFGSEIKNLDSTYEENPFLQDFKETVDSKKVNDEIEGNINNTKDTAKRNQKRTELKVEQTKAEGIQEAKIEKLRADAKAERDNVSNNETAKSQSVSANTNTRKNKLY